MKFRTSALYASAKFRGGLSKNCRSLLRNLMFVPPPHLHTTARLRTDWQVRGLCRCLSLCVISPRGFTSLKKHEAEYSFSGFIPSQKQKNNVLHSHRVSSYWNVNHTMYFCLPHRLKCGRQSSACRRNPSEQANKCTSVFTSMFTSSVGHNQYSTGLLPLPFSVSPHHLRIQQTNKARLCWYLFKGSDGPKNYGSLL